MIIKHSSQKLPINLTERTHSKQGFAAVFQPNDKVLPVWEWKKKKELQKRKTFQSSSSLWQIWGQDEAGRFPKGIRKLGSPWGIVFPFPWEGNRVTMSTGSRLKGGKVARNSPSESDLLGSERINDNRTIASTLPPWRWGKARRLITPVPVSRLSFTATHQRNYHSHLCRAPPVSGPRAARLGCLEMSRKRAASQNTSQGAGGAPVKELVRRWCSVTLMCLTVSNSVDCGSPGSSAHGSFQARILERVGIPDRGIKPTSPVSPALAGGFFTTDLPGKP